MAVFRNAPAPSAGHNSHAGLSSLTPIGERIVGHVMRAVLHARLPARTGPFSQRASETAHESVQYISRGEKPACAM